MPLKLILSVLSSTVLLCFGPNLFAQQFILAAGAVNSTLSDSRSVNFMDLNNDGWIDLFVSNGLSGGQKDLLYLNDGKGLLKAVTMADITDTEFPSDGASFADYNNDGLLDAAVSSWYGSPDLVFLNDNNGRLVQQNDIGIAPGSFAETAVFGDYNEDGLLDIYITNSSGNNRNYLYRNLGNGKFEWMKDHILASERKPSRGAIWIDINNDGYMDLFVANEGDNSNDIYFGKGAGNFERLTRGSIGVGGAGSMTGSWGDIDNDGDLDAFIGNSGFFTGQKNQLYKNFGDSFGEQINDPIAERSDCTFGSAFGDYDNDGDLDLAVSNGFCNTNSINRLYENQGDGTFKDVTTLLVVNPNVCSFGIAWGDVNNDGFLDLMVANCKNNAEDSEKFNRLLMNQGNDNNWLELTLKGRQSNTSAIGTKVRMKATINGKSTWQMRAVTAQSGYAGQNSPVVHFGLEQAAKADSIILIWPSGLVETLVDIQANQRLSKEEGVSTSIHDLSTKIEWKISPNPMAQNIDSLWMQLNSQEAWLQARFYLLNAQGQSIEQRVFDIKKGRQEWTWHLGQRTLSAGIYFAVIQTNTGRVSQKIVVR